MNNIKVIVVANNETDIPNAQQLEQLINSVLAETDTSDDLMDALAYSYGIEQTEPETADGDTEYVSDYIEPGDADYVKSEHVVSLIEDITINTLSAPGTISLETAHTLSVLADLRSEYI